MRVELTFRDENYGSLRGKMGVRPITDSKFASKEAARILKSLGYGFCEERKSWVINEEHFVPKQAITAFASLGFQVDDIYVGHLINRF